MICHDHSTDASLTNIFNECCDTCNGDCVVLFSLAANKQETHGKSHHHGQQDWNDNANMLIDLHQMIGTSSTVKQKEEVEEEAVNSAQLSPRGPLVGRHCKQSIRCCYCSGQE